MKKTIEKEVSYCDVCGKESSYSSVCIGCGKEFCSNCYDKAGTSFPHSVWFSGSGDGYYCRPCEANLLSKKDKRLLAYKRILELREESKLWGIDFQKRADQAAETTKKLAP